MTPLGANHGDDEGFPARCDVGLVEDQTRSGCYPNASEYVCAAATRTARMGSTGCNGWSMRGWGVGLRSVRCGRCGRRRGGGRAVN